MTRATRQPTISLKTYIDARLDAKDLRDQQRFDSQTKAVESAFSAQQCVSGDTLILCADLLWRRADMLSVGQELIGFDAESNNTAGRGSRFFRRATVTANQQQKDDLILVSTTSGAVRCNSGHPWLVKTKHGNKWGWRLTQDLKPGLQVMHVLDVWEEDRSWDGGWMSGMYDGEGWLTFSPDGNSARLGIAQADGPVAQKLLNEIRSRLGREPSTSYVEGGKYHNTKGINRYQVSKKADVLKFLGSIRPARLLVNADRVWENKGISGDARFATVVSVSPVGRGTIASLSTSTGTYIAAGFAMHNTAMQTALSAADRAVQAALSAAEKAVTKAEVSAEKRFDAVNEFRAAYQDVISHQLPRAEAETRFVVMREAIDDLKTRMTAGAGHAAGLGDGWKWLVAAIGVAGTIAALLLRH